MDAGHSNFINTLNLPACQVECKYNQVYYIEAATGKVLQFYSYWG